MKLLWAELECLCWKCVPHETHRYYSLVFQVIVYGAYALLGSSGLFGSCFVKKRHKLSHSNVEFILALPFEITVMSDA